VQHKLKYGAPKVIGVDQQLTIVRFDNRSANRKDHPHIAGFCREERTEQAKPPFSRQAQFCGIKFV
jgi:hypothetical protein